MGASSEARAVHELLADGSALDAAAGVAAERSQPLEYTTGRYAPSWVDRLQSVIEATSLPWWLPYVAVFLVLEAIGHVAFWIDGLLPVGGINPTRAPAYGAFYPTYILGAMHYLDRLASRRLEVFRPALGPVDDETYDGLRRELTTMPARPVLWLTVLGSTFPTVVFLLTTPLIGTGLVSAVLSRVMLLLTLGTGVVFYYHAFHQLRAVERIHAAATDVDLFEPQPLHAFSQLAARSGIAFLLLAYYAAAVRPDFVFTNPVGDAALGLAVASAVLSFVLPLWGIHQRLEAEKHNLLSIADVRIHEAVASAWRQLQGPPSDQDAETVQRRLETVERAKAIVEKLPTWPWAAGTIRGFASTLLLPVVVWLITNVLGRVLPRP